MTSRVVRELEHMPCEERQREWGMFSHKRHQGDQISACQYLQEDNKEDGAELCSGVRQEAKRQWS